MGFEGRKASVTGPRKRAKEDFGFWYRVKKMI
jgi:elongation factor P hydroxylase